MSGYDSEVGKINFKKAFKKIGKAALVTAVPGAGAAMILAKRDKKKNRRAAAASQLAAMPASSQALVTREVARRKAQRAQDADDGYQGPDDGDDDGDGDDGDDDMEGEIGAAGVFKAFGSIGKGLVNVAKAVGPGVAGLVPGAGPALAVALPIVKAAKAGNKGARAKVNQIAVKAAMGDPQAANALEVMRAASAVQDHVARSNSSAQSPSQHSAAHIAAARTLRAKYGI